MSAPVSWQASATYVTSFVNAAKGLGFFEALLPLLDAPTREMVEAPGKQAWWPGQQLLSLLLGLEALGGAAAVKEAGIRGSRERMGPLVRPLAGVLLALSRTPTLALLSRLGTFVAAGVKGIDARFEPFVGRPGGVVNFVFPEPVPAVMAMAWYGLFDVGFALAHAGQVVSEQVEPTLHRFEVSW